jgi:hypothetical protein
MKDFNANISRRFYLFLEKKRRGGEENGVDCFVLFS